MSTSKDHLDYWRDRLRKQKVPKGDWETAGRNRDWEVYIQRRGVREWFNLHTPNREAAASLARDVWRTIVGAGWDQARATYKPEMKRSTRCSSIGEFLSAVKAHSTLKPYTFEQYARRLRTIVAAIREIPYDYNPSHYAAWKVNVESASIDVLSPSAIQRWKKQHLQQAGASPVAQAHARRSINSTLRNAKSLFAERLLKVVPIAFPDPIPFADVEFEKVARPRYRSRIDVRKLIASAEAELRFADPEAYTVFLLALTAGLRRKEIDGLLWSQVDFERNSIRIETTEHTELKSEESEEIVDIPAAVANQLAALKPAAGAAFVVSASAARAKSKTYPTYRCEEAFARLIAWLRIQGVNEDKPIHTLRKEFGSYIAAEHGIYAASHALRHADISTTRTYYVDKKSPIVFGAYAS